MPTTITTLTIGLVDTDDEIRACHPVMVQLRPKVDAPSLVRRVREQAAQGYQMAAVYHEGRPVAVAGFRRVDNLAWGAALYIDDLVSDQTHRSRGVGGQLLDWLVALARTEGCAQLHLDSGVQRFAAHRFYLERRMRIASHHFALDL